MFPDPLIGFFLGADNFMMAHARSQRSESKFAALIPAGLGENGPEISLLKIFGHASSGPVVSAQGRLSHDMARTVVSAILENF